MSGVELWTLMGTDEDVEQIIALIQMSLAVAEDAEIVSPENVTSLRQWCQVENRRLHPRVPGPTREQEVRASLQRSPWFTFWSSLVAEQEVRWTGTKNATYFVVEPEMQADPENSYSRNHPAYIKLRRHSGKEFWTHVGKVRPL